MFTKIVIKVGNATYIIDMSDGTVSEYVMPKDEMQEEQVLVGRVILPKIVKKKVKHRLYRYEL